MYIGIDPLNAVIGVLVKRIVSLKKVIFYTADYAEHRFLNPILDGVYHNLDFFARTYSSKNWVVSTRMISLRKKQKILDSKLVFFPNVPINIENAHTIVRSKYIDLVIVSTLRNDCINFDMAFHAIKSLSKKFPRVRLVIVGSGHDEGILRQKVHDLKILSKVLFTGRKSNDDVYPILKKSTIGLALYRATTAWTYYGDSTKTREYLSVGLPVIITDACSTADDVKNEHAGIVISEKEKNLDGIIASLLNNPDLLNLYRKKALRYAKKINIEKIIEDEIFPA
jgi:glycosyltransferase involved in cell wall biosynthesis